MVLRRSRGVGGDCGLMEMLRWASGWGRFNSNGIEKVGEGSPALVFVFIKFQYTSV